MASLEIEAVCEEELLVKEKNLEKYLENHSQVLAGELPRNREELAGARQNREVEIYNHDTSKQMLIDVKTALKKLKTHSFGVCIKCQEDIREDRLRARPWVSRCILCQEKVGLRVN